LLIEPFDGELLFSFPVAALLHLPADSLDAIALKFLSGSLADLPQTSLSPRDLA
jgi:hypothetical protein